MHAKHARDRTRRAENPSSRWAVRLDSVSKQFGSGPSAVVALRAITLEVDYGSFVAVMGASGSGKSTLLQCAAGLDRPTAGVVTLGDVAISDLDETSLTKLRRDRIGFVFQTYNLVPSLTVAQNIMLPARLAGHPTNRAVLHAILDQFDLTDRMHDRPAQLSGGQQQRVAIARALVTRPDVVFADEPTGALDVRTAGEILRLLRASVDEAHQTVVMVTHDPIAAAHADEVVYLSDGEIVDTRTRPSVHEIAERVTTLEPSR